MLCASHLLLSALRFDLRSSRWSLALVALLGIGLASGCASAPPQDPIPAHRAFSLESQILEETRRIAVYAPPGYEEGSESYPVLYMPDGGVAEDFPHIANTIDSLIRDGEIAPTLVVGIENTVRGRDLTPDSSTDEDGQYAPLSDGAAAFRAFIADELIPHIESTYRTNGERAIVGESLAGLFVVDTFFRQPQLFQRHVAVDPSLWWDDHALVRRAPEDLPSLAGLQRTLWFAGSDAEDIHRHTEALVEILEEHAPEDLTWTYDSRPDEQHWTIFRATKEDAFRWALWKPQR
ncbi:MAG: alpha/beta hydrolase-fold protein [Acidobacteriota bacterium]